jgi:hypothetical protein
VMGAHAASDAPHPPLMEALHRQTYRQTDAFGCIHAPHPSHVCRRSRTSVYLSICLPTFKNPCLGFWAIASGFFFGVQNVWSV